MATNFEFYKDEILEIVNTKNTSFGLLNGKMKSCMEIKCNQCAFGKSPEYPCTTLQTNWLYAENVEQPKLTKRERAFCEAVQTGWIARDEGGEVYWHVSIPEKYHDSWISHSYTNISQMNLDFALVKWEDENPRAVADLLNLEVSNE